MTIDEGKLTPRSISIRTEPFNNIKGVISLGTIIFLLMVIVIAGFIFYRLFSTDKKAQSALGDLTSAVSKSIRYQIPSPQSETLNDSQTAPLSNDETLPTLSRSTGDTLTPADGENPHTTKMGDPATGPKTDIPEPIDDTALSSGGDTDKGDISETNPDSRPGPLEPAKYGETIAPARKPETLYIKVPVGRVRQAPSIDAEILFYLKKGDRVSVIDTRDGWYWIDTVDGRKGWAHGMLFSMDAPYRQAGADSNLIRAILVETPGPNRRAVHIVLSDYHLPRTMVLEGERPRVVCDFYGLHLFPGMKKEVKYGTGLVRAVRVGIHPGENPKIRIVVDLVPEHDYIVEQRFILEENVYLLDIRLK